MSAKDGSTASKADYEAKLSTHMHQAAEQIAELEKRVADAHGQADAWTKTKLDELKAQHKTAEESWQRFQAASEDGWHDLAAGMGDAYDRLQQAIATAQTRFHEKPTGTDGNDAA